MLGKMNAFIMPSGEENKKRVVCAMEANLNIFISDIADSVRYISHDKQEIEQ